KSTGGGVNWRRPSRSCRCLWRRAIRRQCAPHWRASTWSRKSRNWRARKWKRPLISRQITRPQENYSNTCNRASPREAKNDRSWRDDLRTTRELDSQKQQARRLGESSLLCRRGHPALTVLWRTRYFGRGRPWGAVGAGTETQRHG